ncbi:hypothetical protein [Nocardioides sp.]|uniref:hypothetical protein n=1 Tax=Nocardioides sp. TaxID=35761 RepID=UPI0035642973
MGVRLRDRAVVLVPARKADSNGLKRITWDLAPTEVPTPFQGEQTPTPASAEDDGGLATWKGFLPPSLDGIVTSVCRIRWHDEVYEIDGPPVRHRSGRGVRFLTVAMKKTQGN